MTICMRPWRPPRRIYQAIRGIPQSGEGETLDDYEDIYLAFMVLCQDAYDNRSYVAEGTAANRVVCSILDMHARNLI